MNRREFTAIVAAAAFAQRLRAAETRAPGVALFDMRYSASRAFAAGLASKGFAPLATNLDIVRLWHESMPFRAASRIAGITPQSDFQIVHRLLKERSQAAGAPMPRLVSLDSVRAHDRPAALVSWHFA